MQEARLQEFLGLFDMQEIAPLRYRAPSEDLGFRSLFGGQVLAQALVAGQRSVENKIAHSLHLYFLESGDVQQPVDYQVTELRNGRSFAVRRVEGWQNHPKTGEPRAICTALCSFQDEEAGFEHQDPMPTPEKMPTELFSEYEMLNKIKEMIPPKRRDTLTRLRGVELKPVDPINPFSKPARPANHQNWFRAIGQLPDDPMLHQAVITYASDFYFLPTAMRPHKAHVFDKDMQVASLDHSIWFHRPGRADDWLLYHSDSPSAAQGRGYVRGQIFNTAGQLLASTTQEGLMRRLT